MPARPSDKDRMGVKTLGWWVVKAWDRDGRILFHGSLLSVDIIWKIFKNLVRTSKRTPHFTITNINWLTLFKEIFAVYSENHTKPINTKYSITDCQSRWFIKLPLGLKGLIKMYELIFWRGFAIPDKMRGEEFRCTRKVEKHWSQLQ
jgi:hypothetical protein